MKKNYIQPSVEVVNVNAGQMICQSLGIGTNNYNGTDAILGKRRGRVEEDYEEEDLIDIWK